MGVIAESSLPELNEENVNNFIAEREKEIRKVKTRAIKELQEKENDLRNEETDPSGEGKCDKGADLLCEAIMVIRKNPPEKLLKMALFDNKVFSKSYKTLESSAHQRALSAFACNTELKAIIHQFREQYPNWKKERKQFSVQTEQNNNRDVLSEVTEEAIGQSDNMAAGKSKKKKRKSDVNADNEINGSPQKKKKKKDFNSMTEGDDGLTPVSKKKKKKTEANETPNVEVEMNGKKKRKNPIDDMVKRAMAQLKKAAAADDVSEEESQIEANGTINNSDSSDDEVEEASRSYMSLKAKKQPVKKLQNWGGAEGNRGGPTGNARGGFRSGNDRQGYGNDNFVGNRNLPYEANNRGSRGRGNKFSRFDKPGSNTLNVASEGENKFDSPKANGTDASPKGDDKGAGSLLRPTWLTNPEEYKPPPMSSPFNGQNNFQGRGGRGSRGRDGGSRRGGRGSMGRDGGSRRGGRGSRGDSGSANMVRIDPDWKEKLVTKKTDGEGASEGSSLLKPAWLTNPQEYKPQPSFNSFQGKGRGGGNRFGGGGRGRGGRRR